MHTLQEIKSAIGNLSPQQLEELYAWLDDQNQTPFDAQLATGLQAGHLDNAILCALEDDGSGRSKPLLKNGGFLS